MEVKLPVEPINSLGTADYQTKMADLEYTHDGESASHIN